MEHFYPAQDPGEISLSAMVLFLYFSKNDVYFWYFFLLATFFTLKEMWQSFEHQ